MIITLTGANSLMVSSELKKLVNDFIKEHYYFAVERIEGDEGAVERIQEALTSLPFLASRKMVVLRNPSANKLFVEVAEQLFEGLPETTGLIIVESKLDKRI